MEIEFIKDLARKYANVCEFKSNFHHDWKSVNDGYIEGFKTAERLVNENLTIPVVVGSLRDKQSANSNEDRSWLIDTDTVDI